MISSNEESGIVAVIMFVLTLLLVGIGVSIYSGAQPTTTVSGQIMSVLVTDKNSTKPTYHVVVKNNKSGKRDSGIFVDDVLGSYHKGDHVKLTYKGNDLEEINGHE